MKKNETDIETLLSKLKNYIQDGIKQSIKIFPNSELLVGKISAYNDIYDYIEYVLEGDDNNV